MKQQILNIGKALNKAEQRNVFGGELSGGFGCISCTPGTASSVCPSKVCANWIGPDCDKVSCGCGYWCL